MRYAIAFISLAGTIAGPAVPQTKPPAPAATASGVCASLMRSYEGVSMALARNFAKDVGDNSAPRATLRAMEDANVLAEARIALDLMRDNRCPMPKVVPSSAHYMLQALTCHKDSMSLDRKLPESCKRENWKSEQPK